MLQYVDVCGIVALMISHLFVLLPSPQAILSVPHPGAQTSVIIESSDCEDEEVWNAQEHGQVRLKLEDS